MILNCTTFVHVFFAVNNLYTYQPYCGLVLLVDNLPTIEVR